VLSPTPLGDTETMDSGKPKNQELHLSSLSTTSSGWTDVMSLSLSFIIMILSYIIDTYIVRINNVCGKFIIAALSTFSDHDILRPDSKHSNFANVFN
jgi:hypothetical protein